MNLISKFSNLAVLTKKVIKAKSESIRDHEIEAYIRVIEKISSLSKSRGQKFIIGFMTASILFSLIYELMGQGAGEVMIAHGVIDGWTKIWRGWFFCLAFVSIGLATDFRELKSHLKGGKPLVLYICGQTLNLVLTLLMAYFVFYVVFPEVTATI